MQPLVHVDLRLPSGPLLSELQTRAAATVCAAVSAVATCREEFTCAEEAAVRPAFPSVAELCEGSGIHLVAQLHCNRLDPAAQVPLAERGCQGDGRKLRMHLWMEAEVPRLEHPEGLRLLEVEQHLLQTVQLTATWRPVENLLTILISDLRVNISGVAERRIPAFTRALTPEAAQQGCSEWVLAQKMVRVGGQKIHAGRAAVMGLKLRLWGIDVAQGVLQAEWRRGQEH